MHKMRRRAVTGTVFVTTLATSVTLLRLYFSEETETAEQSPDEEGFSDLVKVVIVGLALVVLGIQCLVLAECSKQPPLTLSWSALRAFVTSLCGLPLDCLCSTAFLIVLVGILLGLWSFAFFSALNCIVFPHRSYALVPISVALLLLYMAWCLSGVVLGQWVVEEPSTNLPSSPRTTADGEDDSCCSQEMLEDRSEINTDVECQHSSSDVATGDSKTWPQDKRKDEDTSAGTACPVSTTTDRCSS